MLKKLAIHGSIITVVMISGDLTLNEGKAAQAVLRDFNARAIIAEGHRKAYHANAFVGRSFSSEKGR